MPVSEPSRHWQIQKHQQIVDHESPTAFAQLSELALPHLTAFLCENFPQVETQACETAAIDCLLTYYAAPEKFNPEKLSLFAYLRMAARHDLLNALDKNQRQGRPLLNIDEPGVQEQLVMDEWVEAEAFPLDQSLGREAFRAQQALVTAFEKELSSTDRQLFLLMLNGVRTSEPYAEIMRLDNLTPAEQRRAVKRAKDRLTKKLSRYMTRRQQLKN